jgi:hypothetical protein
MSYALCLSADDVLSVLRQLKKGETATPRDVLRRCGLTTGTTNVTRCGAVLARLVREGRASRPARGRYSA